MSYRPQRQRAPRTSFEAFGRPAYREDFEEDFHFGDHLVGWTCAIVGAGLVVVILIGSFYHG